MNKTTCWRSNFTTQTSTWALNDFSSYRLAVGKTLIVLLACFSLGSLAAWADDTDPWPDQVYFPQRDAQPIQPATTPAKKVESPTNTASASGNSKTPRSMGKLWPFKAKESKAKADFNVIPPKPSAQKADPPASPYPLLRLTMPIVTEQGVIYPGFYLIKPDGGSALTTPLPGTKTSDGPTRAKVELSADTPLLLTRQNQIVARIPIHATTVPDENMAITGTPSPITSASPNPPPVLRVEAKLAGDQRSLRLLVTSGNKHYESDAYPVGTDTRRMLTF